MFDRNIKKSDPVLQSWDVILPEIMELARAILMVTRDREFEPVVSVSAENKKKKKEANCLVKVIGM